MDQTPSLGAALRATQDRFPLPDRTAKALAVFLMLRPSEWRVRRVDHFQPLHFHLAAQQTTLDVKIDASLLQAFVTEADSTLELVPGVPLSEWAPAPGQVVRLLVPLIHQRKPFLVGFSARTEVGLPIHVLTRRSGSLVSAAYLRALVQRADVQIDKEEEPRLLSILTQLCYQNPYVMSDAITQFLTDRGYSHEHILDLSSPLRADWLIETGNAFDRELGIQLAEVIAASAKELSFDLQAPDWFLSETALVRFPRLSVLALGSIGELLDLASGPEATHEPEVESLICENFYGGMAALVDAIYRLARDSRESGAAEHLYNTVWSYAARWTAYGDVSITVNYPSVLKISQTATLSPEVKGLSENRAAFGATPFEVPVPWADASSVHVEVVLEDPELKFHRNKVGFVTDSTRSDPKLTPEERLRLSSINAVSPQIVHFYDNHAQMPNNGGDGRSVRESPLIVYIRLTRTVFWSYVAATLGVLLSVTFVGTEWARGLAHRQGPHDAEATASVTLISMTVALWALGALSRKPIVHKKAVNFRFAILLGVFLIILETSIAGAVWFFLAS